MVIANANHGAASPITQMKLQNFFVRYLQGIEPPNRNLQPMAPGGRAGRGRAGGGNAGGGTVENGANRGGGN